MNHQCLQVIRNDFTDSVWKLAHVPADYNARSSEYIPSQHRFLAAGRNGMIRLYELDSQAGYQSRRQWTHPQNRPITDVRFE